MDPCGCQTQIQMSNMFQLHFGISVNHHEQQQTQSITQEIPSSMSLTFASLTSTTINMTHTVYTNTLQHTQTHSNTLKQTQTHSNTHHTQLITHTRTQTQTYTHL